MKVLWFIMVALTASFAEAHEWHSVDGRSVIAEFVKLSADSVAVRQGKAAPISIPLASLSKDDQTFAKFAQAAVDEALRLGPRSFEVVLPLANGALCRMATKAGNGSVMFIGEQFILVTDPSTLKRGEKRLAVPIFFAGQRSFRPAKGDPSPMKSYALSIDEAADAAIKVATGTLSAEVRESVLETAEVRGIGVAVGEGGLVLVPTALIAGASTIEMFLGNDHVAGTVVTANKELGVTVLSGKGESTPARLAPRKALAVGQPVVSVAFALSRSARGLDAPMLSSGTIKQLGKGFLEHDAPRDPTALGGVLISDKGDVLGILPGKASTKTNRKTGTEPTLDETPQGPSIRSDDLVVFLKSVPKATGVKIAPTASPEESAKSLKASMVLVRVIKETVREPAAPAAKKPSSSKKAPAPKKPGETSSTEEVKPTGWSLSKTGTRHNSTCRFYDAAKACQATDGSPCKVCGG